MLSPLRNFQSLSFIASMFVAISANSVAQETPASKLRAMPQWAAGDKATFQVQQVVKERADGKEETKFLANGTVEITAVESNADSVTFMWHRSMDNAALEMVREPWGIRGNAASEKLINNLIRDGLPAKVRLDLRTQRARIVNREELVLALRRSLQSVGGDFAGNLTGRHRSQSPGEQSNREPTRGQLGIQGPLVKRDESKVAFTPRSAGPIAAWYIRLVQTEIEDFLGALGREYVAEIQAQSAPSAAQTYRPAGASDVLLTLTNAPRPQAPREGVETEDDKEGEPTAVGLAGGALLPAAYEAKIELALPSGWPKRAAIVRTEAESSEANAKRTTQRRVYLRQTP